MSIRRNTATLTTASPLGILPSGRLPSALRSLPPLRSLPFALRSPSLRSLLSALRPLLFALCALLFAFPAPAQAQEIVDKTVATVNASAQPDCRTCLITYSDLLWQLALQPDSSISKPSSEILNGALRLLEDQRLILQEAEKLPTIAPSAEEIQKARDELARQFSSREELQRRMAKVGLTSERLDQILEQRVRIDKYLDFRFRSFTVITPKEIADYYHDVYVSRFKSRYPGRIVPPLAEVKSEIETTLTENKVESDIDNFLDGARERAEIVILSPV